MILAYFSNLATKNGACPSAKCEITRGHCGFCRFFGVIRWLISSLQGLESEVRQDGGRDGLAEPGAAEDRNPAGHSMWCKRASGVSGGRESMGKQRFCEI